MSKVLFYVLTDPSNSMVTYHFLLNAKDLKQKGVDVKIILEGDATKYVTKIGDASHPLNAMYQSIKSSIVAVCKGCAITTRTLEAAEEQGLPVIGNLENHVAIEPYIKEGYQVIFV